MEHLYPSTGSGFSQGSVASVGSICDPAVLSHMGWLPCWASMQVPLNWVCVWWSRGMQLAAAVCVLGLLFLPDAAGGWGGVK
jgi:hypothetical protein